MNLQKSNALGLTLFTISDTEYAALSGRAPRYASIRERSILDAEPPVKDPLA